VWAGGRAGRRARKGKGSQPVGQQDGDEDGNGEILFTNVRDCMSQF